MAFNLQPISEAQHGGIDLQFQHFRIEERVEFKSWWPTWAIGDPVPKQQNKSLSIAEFRFQPLFLNKCWGFELSARHKSRIRRASTLLQVSSVSLKLSKITEGTRYIRKLFLFIKRQRLSVSRCSNHKQNSCKCFFYPPLGGKKTNKVIKHKNHSPKLQRGAIINYTKASIMESGTGFFNF